MPLVSCRFEFLRLFNFLSLRNKLLLHLADFQYCTVARHARRPFPSLVRISSCLMVRRFVDHGDLSCLQKMEIF
jgi:hypothetical protein